MAKLFVVATSSIFVVMVAMQETASSLLNSIPLATAIATIIAAIGAVWVNLIVARKVIAPVAEKVDKIEAHVNSEKTRDQGAIIAKDLQIKLQQEVIEELKRVAALLAQAKATTDISQAVVQAAVAGATIPVQAAPQTTPVLAKIETNTAETAVNTQKTDAAVQELKKDA